jgi:hypothetical protein
MSQENNVQEMLQETVESLKIRLSQLHPDKAQMVLLVTIAKRKYMKASQEYFEAAEEWQTAEDSVTETVSAPKLDATLEEKEKQEKIDSQYTAAERELLNTRQHLISNYRILCGMDNNNRRAEGPIKLPRLPKFSNGEEDSENNMTDVVEWFNNVESILKSNRIPISDWFNSILSSLNSTDRHHASLHFGRTAVTIKSEEEWTSIFKGPFIDYAGGDFHELDSYEQLLVGGAAIFNKDRQPKALINWFNNILVRLHIAGEDRNQMVIVVAFLLALPPGLRGKVRNQLALVRPKKEEMFRDLEVAMEWTRKLANNYEVIKRPLVREERDPQPVLKRQRQQEDSKLCRHCLKDGKRVEWSYTHAQSAHQGSQRDRYTPSREHNALEDLESLDLIKEVNGIDSLGKIHEFYSLDKDHQFYVSDEQSKLAVCTPVTINGHHANALVDTGAKAGNGREIYVDEEFARQIHLEICPTAEKFSRGGVIDQTIGMAMGSLANGTSVFTDMKFIIVASLRYPVILGRNVHSLMGFKLVGLPVKLPGEETSLEQLELPEEDDTILPRQGLEDLPDDIRSALLENASIDPLSHCTHPLAILSFVAKEETLCQAGELSRSR